MGKRLMAIVAEGERGRVYLSANEEMEAVAQLASPEWKSELSLPSDKRALLDTCLRLNNLW